MKYILTLMLCWCGSSYAQSQMDTLCTNDNKFYIARNVTMINDSVVLTLRDSSTKTIAASFIRPCSAQQLIGIRAQAYLNKPKPVTTAPVNLQIPIKPSTYFKRSAGFAGAGLATMIVGGILSGIGASKGAKIPTYIGAGLAGGGLILEIGAIVNLFKGGEALEQKGW